MINFRFERFGDIGLLITKNKVLTLKSADKLKETLKWSLHNVNHLILSFEKVRGIDTSIGKLICFAHCTSIRLNKRLTVTGIQSEMFKQIVDVSGYSTQMVAS